MPLGSAGTVERHAELVASAIAPEGAATVGVRDTCYRTVARKTKTDREATLAAPTRRPGLT